MSTYLGVCLTKHEGLLLVEMFCAFDREEAQAFIEYELGNSPWAHIIETSI